jgi:hypothetical protein
MLWQRFGPGGWAESELAYVQQEVRCDYLELFMQTKGINLDPVILVVEDHAHRCACSR